MDNRIAVRSSGDGVGVVGYISGQSGMTIKFQNFPDASNLIAVDVSYDIATATGISSGVQLRDYAWYTYIEEANAVSYGWPTGGGSVRFGAQ